MTEQELSEENSYRVAERISIMCGTEPPTAKQICIAIEEAAEACEKLRNQ